MSNYIWCHGPTCHEQHTQDRIRGVKGSKVLRTKKIKPYNIENVSFYNYFCSTNCYNQFAHKYVREVIAIAPRTEPLETPIEVTKEKVTSRWNPDHTYVETKITAIDNPS